MKEGKPKTKVYIDGSNVFYSQKKLGWSLDWVKVKEYLDQENDILEYRYYTGLKSTDTKMPNFLKYLDAIGFYTFTKPLKKIKVSKHETSYLISKTGYIYKANFDVEMTADILLDKSNIDRIILFSGDSDFNYLIKKLRDRGQDVIVVSSKETVSWELKLAASKVIYFEKIREQIMVQK